MEYYELHIDTSPKFNHVNGQFLKGSIPFNKGIPMKDWMDGRKIKKVKKYLELGRIKGHPELPEFNKKPIVGIKDGKLYPFESAVTAARILKSKGVKVCSRNICSVIHDKTVVNGKYAYVRKKAGDFRWFFADDIEKYKDLIY